MSPELPAPLQNLLDVMKVPPLGSSDTRIAVPTHRPRKEVDPSKVFTVEQQQAIVAIVEKWWKFRLESIETGKVIEMDDKLDYILAQLDIRPPSSAQLQAWRHKNPRK